MSLLDLFYPPRVKVAFGKLVGEITPKQKKLNTDRKYRTKAADYHRERQRKTYWENPEKKRERCRKWRAENKEKTQAYWQKKYAKDREKIKARRRAYYAKTGK